MQLTCQDCGSTSLSYNTRLRPSKAGYESVLGCDECSATISVFDTKEMFEILSDAIVQMTDKTEMSKILLNLELQ